MPSIDRAILLRDHHRYDEAVAELSRLMAQDPGNAEVHAQLAMTRLSMPGQKAQALESINSAIGLDAEESTYFAVKSLILTRIDRGKEGFDAAEQAIALEPSALGWMAKAQALAGMNRWPEAETACNSALALDPEYVAADNLRAIVLRAQGKLDEAHESAMRRLSRDAEDPISQANAGWTALQRGDRKQAEELFRESLRIDPQNGYARDGLLEAYKSRSPLYRIYLKWVFFLQRHQTKNQWLIILGLYIAYRVSTRLLRGNHSIAAAILVFAYLFFAFGTFVASGLGHFLILIDPLARLSLDRRERWDGVAVGLCIVIGLCGLLLGITLLPTEVAVAGGCILAAAVPASMVFRNYSRTGQLLFGAVAIAAVVSGLFQLTTWLAPSEFTTSMAPALFVSAVIGVALCTWACHIPGLVHHHDRG